MRVGTRAARSEPRTVLPRLMAGISGVFLIPVVVTTLIAVQQWINALNRLEDSAMDGAEWLRTWSSQHASSVEQLLVIGTVFKYLERRIEDVFDGLQETAHDFRAF